MWRHPWDNLEHWWLSRHAPQRTLQLRQRNVYTLPTPAGLMFTALLLVLLVASVNYQLSLGYGLTFLLMGSGLVSMLMTERQLAGLHLSIQQAPAGYRGSQVAVLMALRETAGRMHRSVGLRFETQAQEIWVDVPPNATLSVTLHVHAPRRGLHALPTLRIESRYPYGLLRAWSIWRPATPIIVWPNPEQPTPAWPQRITPPSAHPTRPKPVDDAREQDMDIDDLRPYRHGDAVRKLAWKATARSLAQGGLPLSRETPPSAQSSHHAQPVLFDWADTADLHDPEARLQRLCAWIEHAHPSAYGLTLPGQPTLNPAEGAEHHRRCLDALARMP
ncbi:MAG: DUF58 domain-containing protein [Leptothrix ochracea]|uniref:DUF58 domain-containing protein n=1 Tax=Leptothrix ochracea TaxID=735331 RepID=UPI0034E25AAC